MSSEALENTVAQSLIAIGLFTVSFECTALCFKAKTHEYLTEHEPDKLPKFWKNVKTAYATFDFCGPLLTHHKIISQAELDELNELRAKRNLFAHEGYNHVFDLTVQDVIPDVRKLHSIACKVDRWKVPVLTPKDEPRTVQAQISPAFFGFVAQLVDQLSVERLKIDLTTDKT